MKITPALIQRFFDKECTANEAAEISAFLKSNPQVLDQYLNKSEWDNLVENDNKTEAFWDELWQNIQNRKQKPVKLITFKRIAAAATIIGILGFCGWFYNQQTASPVTKQVGFAYKTIRNNGNGIKQVVLDDGSTVQLSPNSTLSFNEPFQNNKRSIYLKGEALFKVAKDKTKPFTVYSNAISTTALGTEFRVVAFENNQQIKIHLYEGKVVVKPTNAENKKLIKETYLMPGDELTYNKKEMWVKVTHLTQTILAKESAKEMIETTTAITFKKASLAAVFDQLAVKYQTHISYSNKDLENLYFIGTIDKTDSLEHILNKIGKLNGLKINENPDGGYTISQ